MCAPTSTHKAFSPCRVRIVLIYSFYFFKLRGRRVDRIFSTKSKSVRDRIFNCSQVLPLIYYNQISENRFISPIAIKCLRWISELLKSSERSRWAWNKQAIISRKVTEIKIVIHWKWVWKSPSEFLNRMGENTILLIIVKCVLICRSLIIR